MLGLGTPASANPRYDAWQAQHPYILTAWSTHPPLKIPPAYGVELDVVSFLGSGLNTAWEGRCGYSSMRPMASVSLL